MILFTSQRLCKDFENTDDNDGDGNINGSWWWL